MGTRTGNGNGNGSGVGLDLAPLETIATAGTTKTEVAAGDFAAPLVLLLLFMLIILPSH